MTQLRLYHYWRSSCSWRVRWALDEKNIFAQLEHVSLIDGESESPIHRARNPLGHVPVLERLDLPGPERFLGDSTAIMSWLDESFPERPLLPTDLWSRAKVRELAAIITSDTQPLQNIPVLQFYSQDSGQQKAWAQEFIQRGLLAFETLASQVSGRFCFGNELTWADLCLAPQCYNAERYGISLQPFPTIRRVLSAVSNLKSYQSSHPSRYEPRPT